MKQITFRWNEAPIHNKFKIDIYYMYRNMRFPLYLLLFFPCSFASQMAVTNQ